MIYEGEAESLTEYRYEYTRNAVFQGRLHVPEAEHCVRARAPTPDFYYSNYDPKVRPGGRVQHVLHAPRGGPRGLRAPRDYFSAV